MDSSSIRCEGGPCHGTLVDTTIGDRWPAVVVWDGHEGLLGYYERVDQRYEWVFAGYEEFRRR